MDGLVQCSDAEIGFQRVRYPPSQRLAGGPVHDSDQIEEAFAYAVSRSHGDGVIPREQIVELALLVALDDGGERG